MKNLAIVFLCIIWTHLVQAQNNPPCLAADIIILSDRSSSMQGSEVLVGDAISVLVEGIVPEDTRIQFGIVSFGDIARIEIPLTSDYPYLLLSVEEYKKQNATGSTTTIIPGIQTARNMFEESKNDGEHLKIVIIISDGEIHDDYELGEFVDSISEMDNILFFSLGFAPEVIPFDIKSPTLRNLYITYMNINDSLLIRISRGQYFQNNTFRLRDTIRKLGACL